MNKGSLILGILLGAAGMFLLIYLFWEVFYFIFYGIVSIIRRSDNPSSACTKALSNLQAMVLPQIQKDYKDFDLETAKSQAVQFLKEHYAGREEFSVMDIVLNDYRKKGEEKVLVFQAALSWKEKKTVYRRADLCMHIEEDSSLPVCPSCGAPIRESGPYCTGCGTALPPREPLGYTFLKVHEL